jgi:F-type H+-transporting ATPase subunit b
MLEINPGLILWTILTFLVLLVILRMMAWKPLIHALTAREERIRVALQQAEEARRASKDLLEENRRQMANAEEEAQRILREGRELAEKMKGEIVERASSSARTIVEQARDEIRREKEAAITELRAEVADIAITAAGKLLDENLDTPKQRTLVDNVIRDLQKERRA